MPSSVGQCRAIERRDKLANAGRIRTAGDRRRLDAEFRQQLFGRFVVLGMNPGRIERLVAADDLQEAGRLHERRVAQPAHFQQLLAGCGTARAAGDARTRAGP